jgi:hypothetical protein
MRHQPGEFAIRNGGISHGALAEGLASAPPEGPQPKQTKVFCCFFSKQKTFPALSCQHLPRALENRRLLRIRVFDVQ